MQHNLLFRLAFCAIGAGSLLLTACAGSSDRLAATADDPSRPNAASIYYYLSGSYVHYAGDFLAADQLYKFAQEQDSASLQIKKQILINSAYGYLNGQMEKEAVLKLFSDAQSTVELDADLLNAAYSVYSQAGDIDGQSWAIAQTLSRYPSARAYLQQFYLDYTISGSKDTRNLEKAYKLAANNHDDLVLVARMFSLAEPSRSLSILKQAQKLSFKAETGKLLNEMSLQFGSPEESRKLFYTYSYPDDKLLMLNYLQLANKGNKLPLILELQDEIIKTSDSALMSELAFAAYLKDDQAALQGIWQNLKLRTPNHEEDTKLGVLLLANALSAPSIPSAQPFAELLSGASDVDDVILYHTLRQSLLLQTGIIQANPDFSALLAEAAKTKLSDSPISQYLQKAAIATSGDDPDLQQARVSLCESYVLAGYGHEADWTTVLTNYHLQGKTEQKLPLLRQAVEKFPDKPLFLNDLGYSLLDYPDSIAEAGLLILRAVSLEPDSAYYQDSLAWYYYLMQDYEAALKHIAIPLTMEAIPGEIAYHIGMIFIASNNSTAAVDYLKTASQDSQNPDAQQKALQALSSIGINP